MMGLLKPLFYIAAGVGVFYLCLLVLEGLFGVFFTPLGQRFLAWGDDKAERFRARVAYLFDKWFI